MTENKIFTVAIIGCGARGALTYGRLINKRKNHMKKQDNRAWYDISTEDLIDYDMFFDDLYKSFTIHRVEATRAINSKAEKRGKSSS